MEINNVKIAKLIPKKPPVKIAKRAVNWIQAIHIPIMQTIKKITFLNRLSKIGFRYLFKTFLKSLCSDMNLESLLVMKK